MDLGIKEKLMIAGLGAVAVGIVSVGLHYIGYNRGIKARGTAGELRMKSYENPDNPLMKYLLEHNIEDPSLGRLRAFSLTLLHGRYVTPVEEGLFLTILCKAIQARKVIDLGVFTGCSAYAMALGLPADGKVVGCDIDLDSAKSGQPYWEEGGVADKIDLRIQFATETLQELLDNGEGETYDLIFLDADKPNYPNYYLLGLKLLRPGGLFVVDNALFTSSGNVMDLDRYCNENCQAIRDLNRMMRDDDRIDYVLLDIAEGVGIGMKKYT